MAFNDIPYGDEAAVRAYEANAYIDKYKSSPYGLLMDNGCIYSTDALKNANAGDLVTVNTFDVYEGRGRTEDETLENNEEALARGNFQIRFNETWHAGKVPSKSNVKQMRFNTDLLETSIMALADWHTDRAFRSILNQGAGNTATSITVEGTTYTGTAGLNIITGHNTPVAPSSSRIIRPGALTTDESITSADTHTLDMLDNVTALVQSGLPRFSPVSDSIFAIGIMHPKVIRDLMHNSSGAIQYYPNLLAQVSGGDVDAIKSSPLASRSGYMYGNLLIFADYRVPLGVNSSTSAEVSNVYRSVFFGANAIFGASPFGLSLDDEDVPLMLARETFDYGRFTGIGAGFFAGFKKFRGTAAQDNNTFVTVAYAA